MTSVGYAVNNAAFGTVSF